jgi:hypothetical protein
VGRRAARAWRRSADHGPTDTRRAACQRRNFSPCGTGIVSGTLKKDPRHAAESSEIIPEGEEILVGGFCLGLISRQDEGSTQLQARHGAYGVAHNDPAVVENFLEFRGGFRPPLRGQMRLTTHIDRIEGAKENAGRPQLVGHGGFEQFQSLRTVTGIQCEACAKRRQVTEPLIGSSG